MDGTICGSQPVGTEKSRRTLPPALTRRPCTTQADSAPGRPAGPADSGGDVLPVPTRRPRPDNGFGGLAPAALTACRLTQLHRIRNLYRVSLPYHILFCLTRGQMIRNAEICSLFQWPWKGRFQSLLKTWKGKRLPYCCGSLFFYSINAVPAGIPPGSRWRAPPYGCNEGFCAPGQSRADLPPKSSRFDAAALSRQYCGARHSRRPS